MQVHSLEEFNAWATHFASTLTSGERATIVALSGELGAGKTTLVQAVARVFGISDTVASPTFVIEKIYNLEHQRFARLIHIDAYRLHGAHELEVLGWHEITADPGALIFVEWPEQVPGLIPADAIQIRFDILGEERIITVNGSGQENKNSGRR